MTPLVREILNAVTNEPDVWTVAALADDLDVEHDLVWRAIEGPLRLFIARGREQRLHPRMSRCGREAASERVFYVLEHIEGSIRAPELARRIGLEVTGVRRALRALLRQERIPHPVRGFWRHPLQPDAPVVHRRPHTLTLGPWGSTFARRYRGLRSLLLAAVLTEEAQSIEVLRGVTGLRRATLLRALSWLEARGLAHQVDGGWTDSGAVPIVHLKRLHRSAT